MRITRRTHAATLALAGLCATSGASAFCGFYVAGSDATLANRATSVVLLRDGARTVLSMQNTYEGPPENFALVVPVPVVLQRENVRTLPREVFERVDRLSAPRLVEYWEQDPCAQEEGGSGHRGTVNPASGGGGGPGHNASLGVAVEARFAVGEYDVVVLSANDSTGLDTWLRRERYHIPADAAPVLDPYVRAGSRFFVARVDAARVRFEQGRAVLSPLRFHYDSDAFSLPIRLGLLNSPGRQDLIVHVLARGTRYEAANRPNAFSQTNLDVRDAVRDRFGDFYNALFERTLERTPGAVVTEYAWQSASCDPCPVDPLTPAELATLGVDVAPSVQGPDAQPTPFPNLRLQAPEVEGGTTPDAVRTVVLRGLEEVNRCYELDARAHPGASGTIALRLSIGARGTVEFASVARSTYPTPFLFACMRPAVRRWRFAPHEGELATVIVPIEFGDRRANEGAYSNWVLTRLHTRYGRADAGEDLVFRAAPSVAGGREWWTGGALEPTAPTRGPNNYQTRFAIRHAWTGPITCRNPVRGVWGARRGAPADVRSAQGLAFAGRITAPESFIVDASSRRAEQATPTSRPSRFHCGVAASASPRGPWVTALIALAWAALRRRTRNDTLHAVASRQRAA